MRRGQFGVLRMRNILFASAVFVVSAGSSAAQVAAAPPAAQPAASAPCSLLCMLKGGPEQAPAPAPQGTPAQPEAAQAEVRRHNRHSSRRYGWRHRHAPVDVVEEERYVPYRHAKRRAFQNLARLERPHIERRSRRAKAPVDEKPVAEIARPVEPPTPTEPAATPVATPAPEPALAPAPKPVSPFGGLSAFGLR